MRKSRILQRADNRIEKGPAEKLTRQERDKSQDGGQCIGENMQVCSPEIVVMVIVFVIMLMTVDVMTGFFAVKHPDAQDVDHKSDHGDKDGFIKSDGYRVEKTRKRLDKHI